MVEIQSKEVIDKISDELKIQPALAIPRELDKNIKLVYGVNPPKISNVHKFKELLNGTTTTIFITPPDQDFFLTSMSLSMIKDVVSTSIETSIKGNIFGGPLIRLLAIAGITVTAQNATINMTLPRPLLMERGNNIILTNSTGVAVIHSFCTINGFTVDPQ